jgi:hypothetical protein
MKRIAAIVLMFSLGFASRSGATPSLEEILAVLEQANEQIGVVKVEGYTHQYRWDDSTPSWNVTPQTTTFTCTYENRPQGRYVLDEHPTISRWESGAAPYLAEWRTQFRDADGVITWWTRADQHRRASSMSLGASVTQWWDWPTQPHDGFPFSPDPPFSDNELRRGKKSAFLRAMAQQAEKFYSGLGFTGLRAIRNAPVYVPAKWADFTVSDTNDGMTRVQYGVPEICLEFDFILDPRKNFALVRYTRSQNRIITTADGDLSTTLEVLGHRQIASGLWYPVHCTSTTTYSKEYAAFLRSRYPESDAQNRPDPYTPARGELVLTKVSLLAGIDAETNLTVKLPDGLTVIDEDQHQ